MEAKINKKSWFFFKKINKIDKLLTSKKGKQTHKIRNVKGKNIKQKILKKSWGYFIQLYVKSFENLDEINTHLKKIFYQI